MKRNEKKGQLTILLIIAALLLLTGGIVWYAITEFDLIGSDAGSQSVTDRNQIEQFVESCLDTSARDVFTRVGEQAGYVNPARDGIPALPGAATEGPALEAFSGITAPYWSHLSSPNDCLKCVHASQQPPLEGSAFPAIQYQAEQEIATRTIECLDSFNTFAGQYTVTPESAPVVTVTFGETETVVELDYALAIDGTGEQTRSSSFQAVIDAPIKRLYEVADAIRQQADATGYFEARALEEVTLASALDGANIPPPQGGLEIGYDPGPFWPLITIEPVVREAIERGTGMVQLFGSRGADFITTGDPAQDNLYLQYYLFLDEDVSDIQANFIYLGDWGSYVNVNPRSGQLVSPELMSSGIPFIPNIKRMDFQYDVSHPVLIQLRAPTRTGEYLFQFPIEVNLRRNNPTAFTPVTALPELQDICSPEIVNGPTVTVTTKNQDGQPLAARLRFECVNAACPLGESAGGSIETRVPACLQGVVIAEREGYLAAEQTFDATGTTPLTVDLTLQRLTTVEIELDGFLLEKREPTPEELIAGVTDTWAFGEPVAINGNQTAVVELEPQGFGESQFIVVPPQERGRTSMDLAPGEYAIRIFIIEELPEPKLLKGEEICDGGFIGIGESCKTIPDITIGEPTFTDPTTRETYDVGTQSLPVGGLTWDETTKLVTISPNDLAAGRLRIPVVVIDTESLTKVLDLQVFEDLEDLSMELALLPVPLDE